MVNVPVPSFGPEIGSFSSSRLTKLPSFCHAELMN